MALLYWLPGLSFTISHERIHLGGMKEAARCGLFYLGSLYNAPSRAAPNCTARGRTEPMSRYAREKRANFFIL